MCHSSAGGGGSGPRLSGQPVLLRMVEPQVNERPCLKGGQCLRSDGQGCPLASTHTRACLFSSPSHTSSMPVKSPLSHVLKDFKLDSAPFGAFVSGGYDHQVKSLPASARHTWSRLLATVTISSVSVIHLGYHRLPCTLNSTICAPNYEVQKCYWKKI